MSLYLEYFPAAAIHRHPRSTPPRILSRQTHRTEQFRPPTIYAPPTAFALLPRLLISELYAPLLSAAPSLPLHRVCPFPAAAPPVLHQVGGGFVAREGSSIRARKNPVAACAPTASHMRLERASYSASPDLPMFCRADVPWPVAAGIFFFRTWSTAS
jgi:hypothetical protein